MALVTVDQNVKFNGALEDVVVLKVDGDNRTVVLWEQLSELDKALLTSMVDDFGGSAPLAAPTAGFAAVDFKGALGTDPTGLDSVATATAGKATVDLGAAKLATDNSGLVVVSGSTAGSQVVTINPVFTAGTDATGLAADVPATAGRATVTSDVAVAASDIAISTSGTYYFDASKDGEPLSSYTITITTPSTYSEVASLLDASLAGIGVSVSFDDTADAFVFTRDITGSTTSVNVAAGVTPVDVFSQIVADGAPTSFTFDTPVDGTDAVVTTYTATIVVDGVTKNISVAGGAAQTVTTLLSEINTDLGASATAALVSGSIKVTSATVGSTSTVAITDGTLFAALTGTATIETATAGTDGEGGDVAYHAIVEVDGVGYNVTFTGAAGVTVQDVIDEIDADLGTAASVALTGGDIVITSGTTGKASRVRIFDTGELFSRLTDYVGVSYVDGVAPRVYTATVTVDGVANAVSVQGSAAQTFADLVTEITADVVGATVALVNGKVVVTSDTTGTTSTVVVTDGDLFKSCAGFNGVKTVNGAADLVAAFGEMRMSNGSKVLEYFPTATVGLKPADNTPYAPPKRVEFSYFGGTPAVWRYMNDDTEINP